MNSSTHARSHGFTEAIVVYFCDHDYVDTIHRQQHIYICIYKYIYIYIWMLYVNIYIYVGARIHVSVEVFVDRAGL